MGVSVTLPNPACIRVHTYAPPFHLRVERIRDHIIEAPQRAPAPRPMADARTQAEREADDEY